jgi:hypothetical protein
MSDAMERDISYPSEASTRQPSMTDAICPGTNDVRLGMLLKRDAPQRCETLSGNFALSWLAGSSALLVDDGPASGLGTAVHDKSTSFDFICEFEPSSQSFCTVSSALIVTYTVVAAAVTTGIAI